VSVGGSQCAVLSRNTSTPARMSCAILPREAGPSVATILVRFGNCMNRRPDLYPCTLGKPTTGTRALPRPAAPRSPVASWTAGYRTKAGSRGKRGAAGKRGGAVTRPEAAHGRADGAADRSERERRAVLVPPLLPASLPGGAGARGCIVELDALSGQLAQRSVGGEPHERLGVGERDEQRFDRLRRPEVAQARDGQATDEQVAVL